MTETKTDRQKAIEKLQNPKHWPGWPVLPMKRGRHGTIQAGFCVTADYPSIVLKGFPSMRGIILQLSCEDGMPVPGNPDETFHADEEARKVYEAVVYKRYEDLDGMLDDGWRID